MGTNKLLPEPVGYIYPQLIPLKVLLLHKVQGTEPELRSPAGSLLSLLSLPRAQGGVWGHVGIKRGVSSAWRGHSTLGNQIRQFQGWRNSRAIPQGGSAAPAWGGRFF